MKNEYSTLKKRRKIQKIVTTITFIFSLVLSLVLFAELGYELTKEYDETFTVNRYEEKDGDLSGAFYYSIFVAAFFAFKVYRVFEDKTKFKIKRDNYYWNFWFVFLAINFIPLFVLKKIAMPDYLYFTINNIIFVVSSYIFIRIYKKKSAIFKKEKPKSGPSYFSY